MLRCPLWRFGGQKCLTMSNQIRKNQSPDEKKNQPLGKSFPSIKHAVNSFASQLNDRNNHRSLTTVSSDKKTPPLLSREQEVSRLLSGCDATKADSSTAAWTIKIFLN